MDLVPASVEFANFFDGAATREGARTVTALSTYMYARLACRLVSPDSRTSRTLRCAMVTWHYSTSTHRHTTEIEFAAFLLACKIGGTSWHRTI